MRMEKYEEENKSKWTGSEKDYDSETFSLLFLYVENKKKKQ